MAKIKEEAGPFEIVNEKRNNIHAYVQLKKAYI
jgi:hypothetical protein